MSSAFAVESVTADGVSEISSFFRSSIFVFSFCCSRTNCKSHRTAAGLAHRLRDIGERFDRRPSTMKTMSSDFQAGWSRGRARDDACDFAGA